MSQGQSALRIHQKYLNLCSEDEQRHYGFGTTWGWVINDRIFIFGWTIPLSDRLRVLLHPKMKMLSLKWQTTNRIIRIRSLRPVYSQKWRYADAEETNCWLKSLFLFSLCTKSILVASWNYSWITVAKLFKYLKKKKKKLYMYCPVMILTGFRCNL